MSSVSLVSKANTVPALSVGREKLHPYIVYDPQKEYTYSYQCIKVWRAAKVVSLVVMALFEVAIVVVPFASVLHIAFKYQATPFVFWGIAGIGGTLVIAIMVYASLFLPIDRVESYIENKQSQHEKSLSYTSKILEQIRKFEGKDPSQLLAELGIEVTQIKSKAIQDSPSLVKPLIAFYHVLQTEVEEFLNASWSSKELEFWATWITRKRISSAVLKVTMGFILHVLQHPLESRLRVEEYCKVFSDENHRDTYDRFPGKAVDQPPHKNLFLQTKTEPVREYTVEEILAISPIDLARAIFSS